LKILETTSSIDTANCVSYKSPSGRYEWYLSGNYTDTLTNSNGCDSVISIAYSQKTTASNIVFIVCDSLLSPSKKYTYTSPGVYIDTIQNNANCDSIVTINLQIEPITLKITKSNDISCDTPFSNLLAEGANSFLWSPIIGLSNPNIYNPTANPEKSITYYVLAKNNIGCTAIDSIELLVDKISKETDPINVFTPNGDGYNDCFLVQSIADFETLDFAVYNRWGSLVYKTNKVNACWDGSSSKGENLVEGTYYYLLSGKNTCGENIELHGSISLLR
jgi:gliding motility-associated-like protein